MYRITIITILLVINYYYLRLLIMIVIIINYYFRIISCDEMSVFLTKSFMLNGNYGLKMKKINFGFSGESGARFPGHPLECIGDRSTLPSTYINGTAHGRKHVQLQAVARLPQPMLSRPRSYHRVDLTTFTPFRSLSTKRKSTSKTTMPPFVTRYEE